MVCFYICHIQLMIDIIARIFCIRDKLIEDQQMESSQKVVCSQVRLLNDGKEEQTFMLPKATSMQNTGLMQHQQQNSGLQQVFEQNNHHTSPDSNDNDRFAILKSSLAADLRKIREIMEFYKDKKEKAEKKEKYLREWRVICCVTDRFFFILYLIINISMIIVIFYGINWFVKIYSNPSLLLFTTSLIWDYVFEVCKFFFFYCNFGFFSIVVWMCQFETFGLANTFQDLFSQILPKWNIYLCNFVTTVWFFIRWRELGSHFDIKQKW